MDFDLTSDDLNFLARVAEVAAEAGSGAAGPPATEADARDRAEALLGRLAECGYLAMGFDDSAPERAVVDLAAMETLAAGAPGAMLTAAVSTRVLGRAIAAWGTAPQREQWLAPLTAGRALGVLGLSEASQNVDNDPLETVIQGDGETLRLRGKKSFAINAPLADIFGVVGLRDDRPVIGLLTRDTAGLSVAPRIRTMGHEELWIAAIALADVSIAPEALIAPPADIDLLDQLRRWENEVLTAQALGLMKAAYESARDYAKAHRSGGKPIIAYQAVGFKLAEMLTLLQTAELLAYRAVWTAAADPRAGRSLNWCAKVFCSEAAERVAGDALRILGQAGYRDGSPAAGAYRAVKLTQIGGTSTEIARVKIGDAALGY
jgi:alkylation response protein AidB-like acyl-CoA dehydrogenase